MSYIRCHLCRGQKKVRGLGSMLKKCVVCNATGYIQQDEPEADLRHIDEILANADSVSVDSVKDDAALAESTSKRQSRFKKDK